jgi:hypothetical protein
MFKAKAALTVIIQDEIDSSLAEQKSAATADEERLFDDTRGWH